MPPTPAQTHWSAAKPRDIAIGASLAVAFGALVAYKALAIQVLTQNAFVGLYGAVAGTYILTRFVLSLFCRTPADCGFEPTVAVVIPAFNEQEAIASSLTSVLAVDYPETKLEIVAINDGSTDSTLAELTAVADSSEGRVTVINFTQNRGKRAAMAAGIRATAAEVVVFVDSDSTLRHDAIRKIVQPLSDGRVGAVCGQAHVANTHANWLTRMQAVRYCTAFAVIKGAESIFGAVTCCSGCFSAYRRSAIMPRLDWWENQRFLGRPATIGDDRSLTNCVMRNWRVVYHNEAVAATIVPSTFRAYLRQQARWKRSWTRESLQVAMFIWRKHPAAALATYASIVMPLLVPLGLLRSISLHAGGPSLTSLLVLLGGVCVLSIVSCLYYALRTRGCGFVWAFGLAWIVVYGGVMWWLTYYALVTCKSGSWGTRPSGSSARRVPRPLGWPGLARNLRPVWSAAALLVSALALVPGGALEPSEVGASRTHSAAPQAPETGALSPAGDAVSGRVSRRAEVSP